LSKPESSAGPKSFGLTPSRTPVFFLTSFVLCLTAACFGAAPSSQTGGTAGEGQTCEAVDPQTLGSPSPELTIEIGQGRSKLEFQPYINEDQLELIQGAQGMAMIVYDLQVRASGLSGRDLCATIVANNRFSKIDQKEYLAQTRRAYVLERNDDDFYAGPVYHPFGWNPPEDYQAEQFNVTLKVFVGNKQGSVSREFELIDANQP